MMKKAIVSFSCAVLAAACTPKQTCVKGVIVDATMNTISIVSQQGDTLRFGTADAERSTPDGILLNDSATVCYTGPYSDGISALKIEVSGKSGLLGGDRDDHGCIGSAGYTWSAVRQDCIQIFEQGVRTESVDGDGAAFIVFSPDSAQVELFFSDGRPNEILDRRALPDGGYAWNVEDDDTKNIRLQNGLWTIGQRGNIIYTQRAEETDASLGEVQTLTYEGLLPAASCPGIRYELTIRSREHSGDGTFSLTTTYLEAENGQDRSFTYTGRRFTQRGIPGDDNATVWQLIADEGGDIFNFLREDEKTLTLLNEQLEKNDTDLNYSLKLKK